MSLAIHSTENAADKIANREHHAAALIAALGNPSLYDSDGDPIDCGGSGDAKCACGHPVRWLFPIKHRENGRTSAVGSTCIDHIAGINPELGEALNNRLQELNAKIAEMKAKAKRAAADELNAQLWETYSALRDKAIEVRRGDLEARIRSPYPLWYFVESYGCKFRRETPPAYQRAGDLRKWIEKAIRFLNEECKISL